MRHFAQHIARNMKKQIESISSETMNALLRYPWPGNIREMQNVIERAVILSRGSILHIPSADLKSRSGEVPEANGLATLEEVERKHIVAVLEQTNWVFSGPNGAATRLGLKRPPCNSVCKSLGSLDRCRPCPQKPQCNHANARRLAECQRISTRYLCCSGGNRWTPNEFPRNR